MESEVGRSVEGRPIRLVSFGDPADPVVLIFGGIHGNEPTSAVICERLIDEMRRHPETYAGRRVAVAPAVNPDGLARRRRTNARLVDLNRNFPAANWKPSRKTGFWGGDEPASEPETKVILSLLDDLRPVRIISIHSMSSPCNNYDGPADALARAMADQNRYPIRASIGYPTPGSFGSLAGIDRGIPTVTLELPARQSGDESWQAVGASLLTAIRGGGG